MTLKRSVVTMAVFLAPACSLVSSDIATINFDLPKKSYSFDTSKSGWNLPAATLPSVPCTEPTSCCSLAMLAGIDCSIVICDGASGTCAFTATVETPPQTMNLKSEVPQLSGISQQSLVDVTISKISYDVTTNTMNVDLPAIDLYVADQGASSTSDPSATKFGTVPATPAGATLAGGSVTLTPEGQAAFIGYAHNFGTSFVFIGRTTVVVPGGTPIPMGAVDLTVQGQVSAKPSF
jgi:hypothetical protein